MFDGITNAAEPRALIILRLAKVTFVSNDTELDARGNARKPTKTSMFYDPLLGAGIFIF